MVTLLNDKTPFSSLIPYRYCGRIIGMKKIFLYGFLLSFFLSGCITTQSGKIESTSFSKTSNSNGVELTFLTYSQYNSDMTIALAERGFVIKPITSQQEVTKKDIEGSEYKFDEASARYGIKIEWDYKGVVCVFSSNIVLEWTISLIDIQTNSLINIFKQKAPDGKCPPLKPVFGTYADHISSLNL